MEKDKKTAIAEEVKSSRGTIVVDTNFLFGICADIPNTNPPNKYLDLLPELAKHGYKIIIPEMVSYGAGQILASGADIGKRFDSDNEFTNIRKIIKPFLKDVAAHRYENIDVVKNTGPEAVDKFCNRLQELEAWYPARVSEIKAELKQFGGSLKTSPQVKASNEWRVSFDAAAHELRVHNGSGDKAVLAVVDNLCATGNGQNLFVFTDNGLLRDRIKAIGDVKSVTTNNFVHSLCISGLGAELGFPDGISADELEAQRRASIVATGITQSNKEQNGDERISSAQYNKSLEIARITKSFKVLADELLAVRVHGKANTPAEEPAQIGSTATRFNDKFAKFADMRKRIVSGQNSGEFVQR